MGERRASQRMKLAKPLMAMVEKQNALVLDVGVEGAFIEHYGEVAPGSRLNLTFRWHGQDVDYVCEVMRSEVVREARGAAPVVSHTGVRFVSAVGDSEARLHDMMATFIGRILAAQKANASGLTSGAEGEVILARLGEARRVRTGGFATYTLSKGQWQRKVSNRPQQPTEGFTVAAYESEEELQELCRAYEMTDAEGRRLIQLVAVLSVLSVRRK